MLKAVAIFESGGGGGTIGGSISANQVAYGSGANTITGSANLTFNGSLETLLATSLGTTQTDAKGFLLTNTTAAALNAQQISPSIHWHGNGWHTNGGGSNVVDFRAYLLPVQGANIPSSIWKLQSNVAGSGYTDVWNVDSNGTIATNNTYSGSNIFSGVNQFTGSETDFTNTINIFRPADRILFTGHSSGNGRIDTSANFTYNDSIGQMTINGNAATAVSQLNILASDDFQSSIRLARNDLTAGYIIGHDFNDSGENNFFFYNIIGGDTPIFINGDNSNFVGFNNLTPQAPVDAVSKTIAIGDPANGTGTLNGTGLGTGIICPDDGIYDYLVYASKTVSGTPIYSVTPATDTVDIQLAPIAPSSATQVDGVGAYTADGTNIFTYLIFAVYADGKTNPVGLSQGFTDNGNLSAFSVDLTWTAPVGDIPTDYYVYNSTTGNAAYVGGSVEAITDDGSWTAYADPGITLISIGTTWGAVTGATTYFVQPDDLITGGGKWINAGNVLSITDDASGWVASSTPTPASALSPAINSDGMGIFKNTVGNLEPSLQAYATSNGGPSQGWYNNASDLAAFMDADGNLTCANVDGIWVGGIITPTKGGTGFASYVVGDILYADTTTTLAKRAIGGNGRFLQVVGGVPDWFDLLSSNVTFAGNNTYSGTPSFTSTTTFAGLKFKYVVKTANYTLTATDYTVNATSGTFTLTLPTSVGNQGRIYVLKNSGAGVVTVATTSSQTIDGVTTFSLATQYQSITVQSDNANWIII